MATKLWDYYEDQSFDELAGTISRQIEHGLRKKDVNEEVDRYGLYIMAYASDDWIETTYINRPFFSERHAFLMWMGFARKAEVWNRNGKMFRLDKKNGLVLVLNLPKEEIEELSWKKEDFEKEDMPDVYKWYINMEEPDNYLDYDLTFRTYLDMGTY